MNDKLQIRDLVAMLLQPGIDPASTITVGDNEHEAMIHRVEKNDAGQYRIRVEFSEVKQAIRTSLLEAIDEIIPEDTRKP